jgi:hypothetical protein
MVTGGGFTMFIGGSGHVEAKRKGSSSAYAMDFSQSVTNQNNGKY